ncbi:SlyX family protein [Arenimonas sp. MALMAid1274]|uniref:SlyX family protein n=1 Tax=Arenimonas sp. MALMAid1274 TaxID=3411630 RepID=UPI003B9DDAE7
MSAGTDPALEARLAELETRQAFQEHTLTELSDALAEARAEITRNTLSLQRALTDLKQLRTLLYADPGAEPPPPHY